MERPQQRGERFGVVTDTMEVYGMGIIDLRDLGATDDEIEADQAWRHATHNRIGYHLVEALDTAEQLGCRDPFKEVENLLWYIQQEYHAKIGYEKPPRADGRVPFKQKQRRLILERDAYRCVLCGSYGNLHVDHIIPVSKGGANDDANLRTLCAKCNLSKGARV